MKKNVFDKIRRKLLKILYQIIHKHHTYKPTGSYHSINNYVESDPATQARYIEIYPKLISTLHISKEMYEACSIYVRPILSAETDYKVAILPNGRIHTDNESSVAIISHDNKLIGDISFNYNESKIISAELNTIFKQNYYSTPKKIQGTVFTLLTGGAGLNNYFHWLIDSLPRIHLLKKSGYFDQIDWFLVPSYRLPYQKDTLGLLGITKDKIIEGDKYPHIQAETIIASTAPRGNHTIIPVWVCDFLRSNFLNSQKKPQHNYRYVYISRKDSAIRHITNEEALWALLKNYNFNKLVLNEVTFEEQINVFAFAEMIIAPHGAGLINLVFCNRGTTVLEIFASGYVKATYYDLSRKTGLNYLYLICPSKKVKTAKKGMKLDIVVELDKIKSILDELIPAVHNSSLSKENL
ncbi:glycosyltransferase family 61 protein [Rhodocytophaga rosea]|uniref:Glycosyltransferase family 61 protein n=1 Tax=Rhodocytophaga rosea TaxID=2704465 RepID=A0A6C0GHF5_9BACT|nr:glycosyltransferase family 61 protein [Rhodocytophaga rosea]QHT67122.1 glycosyltransferase family 61 protein [Rhodocytophaga rosea]